MTATTDILQDFRSTLRGLDASALEVLDDSRLARALYSSDASIYRVVPTAIAHPRSTDELSALVTAASQVGLPITARGAGTTCAGNAVGAGLVIDTSAHLNRILSSILRPVPPSSSLVSFRTGCSTPEPGTGCGSARTRPPQHVALSAG